MSNFCRTALNTERPCSWLNNPGSSPSAISWFGLREGSSPPGPSATSYKYPPASYQNRFRSDFLAAFASFL